MKGKKIFALIFAVLMLFVVACGSQGGTSDPGSSGGGQTGSDGGGSSGGTGGGGGGDSTPAGEMMQVRYVMPGAPSTDTDMVNEEINKRLAADGLPLDFSTIYIPWDQWVDRTNVMLSVGEEFEIIHVMGDFIPISNYAARNAITALDDLINQYAPNLWGRFDDVMWKSASLGGQVLAIPAVWRDNSGAIEGMVTVRGDKFDEFGISIPQTPAEIISSLSELQPLWAAQDGMDRYVWEHTPDRPPVALHRTYDTWPFYVSDGGIFKVSQNGAVELFFESAEFKKDADFMRELFVRGLTHPDILNFPRDTKVDLQNNGDALLLLMTPMGTSQSMQRDGVEGAIDYKYWMNDSGPFLMATPLMNMNSIPDTTPNPQAGVMFIDWVYSNRDNHSLVLYGIEGVHWEAVGNDERTIARDSENVPLYEFDYWMFEYVPYHRFIAGEEMAGGGLTREQYVGNTRASQTVQSPVIGFVFNTDSVSVEFANVMAEYTASILPIKLGVVSYDDGFARAMDNMRAAGCDALLAEYARQMAEHIG